MPEDDDYVINFVSFDKNMIYSKDVTTTVYYPLILTDFRALSECQNCCQIAVKDTVNCQLSTVNCQRQFVRVRAIYAWYLISQLFRSVISHNLKASTN